MQLILLASEIRVYKHRKRRNDRYEQIPVAYEHDRRYPSYEHVADNAAAERRSHRQKQYAEDIGPLLDGDHSPRHGKGCRADELKDKHYLVHHTLNLNSVTSPSCMT